MSAPRRAVTLTAALSLFAGGLAALSTAPASAVPGTTSDVFVNEIHYDNDGTDSGELVEVAGPAGTDLSGWSLVLYNGNGGAPYDTKALSGTIPSQSGGYGTVVQTYPSNGIQNGSPDGIALVNGSTVVQFLSYEGPMTAASGVAAGQTSTDIGVTEVGTEPAGQSLQLTGTGTTAGDFTWAAPAAATPGQANTGQTFGGPGSAPLAASDQADVSVTVDEPIDPITLQASGGTPPYTWEVTGLPAGLAEGEDGVISGTPTATGTSTVTAEVTDSASPAATDSVTFDVAVVEAAEPTPIAEIQGEGAESPLVGETVTTEGVVTAVYDTGGKNGFVIQTPDAEPGAASHGLFVYTFNGTRAGLVEEGDAVEVTGEVSEYFGLTQVTAGSNDDISVSGTGTITPADLAWPGADADREALESMLLDLSGQEFTVSNNFSTNRYGEIGLAAGDRPLVTPTEVANPSDTAAYDAAVADNAARGLILDDGASTDYQTNDAAKDQPLPWIDQDITARVGAAATLEAPVVLDYGFSAWRAQPTSAVTGVQPDLVTFEDTRPANAEPRDVGGDLTLATFNVLNYFNTTGKDWEARGNECTYFVDRDGDEVTNNSCSSNGPRGAAEDEDLTRQQAKIVAAVNGLDASVVSLEEIENSRSLGETDRDDALAELTAALNEEAGEERWAFVPSPAEEDLPASEDVIRTAFIYDPASVELEGESVILDDPAFDNARQPLAQAFRPAGSDDDRAAFAVVVNHFKSKGSACAGEPNGPQGNCNESRVAQAEALAGFADGFADDRGLERVFLTGDFNAYTEEDPILALEDAGYTPLESDTEDEWSYSFSGQSGSLDHVLANDAALAAVTGVDIWEINANEAIAYEYSRFNYNVTDFYAPDVFRASDHNPEIVGIDVPAPRAAVDLDIDLRPGKVEAGKTRPRLVVEVEEERDRRHRGGGHRHDDVEGVVRVTYEDEVRTETLRRGKALFELGTFDEPGRVTITVEYLGDDTHAPRTETITVEVREGKGRR